ncbi:MAG TPA: four helix bundle protein, partial [Thermoanaerobaculia bacterium]|nr:four helix bundle protein [Thermoanaerobaculia bacterium]
HAEQARFYFISRGSLLEVETQLYIASDLDYLGPDARELVLKRSGKIGRMLNGLIKRASGKKV